MQLRIRLLRKKEAMNYIPPCTNLGITNLTLYLRYLIYNILLELE